MKVLIVEPMSEPFVKDIEPSWETMRAIVGGTIQALYPFEDGEVAIICNDDVKPIDLSLNKALFDENGRI